MNRKCYRLVYSRAKKMMVAVPEFAAGQGGDQDDSPSSPNASPLLSWPFDACVSRRIIALAVTFAFGTAMSPLAHAQITAAPGSGARVIQTQNGLPQVNIAKPSTAGVSLNNYSQFDVSNKGAILNNAATIVQTQQAGYINGNPNLSPGNAAKVIVNQVISNAPSQLHGYVEVAGQRAEVVIANPNGLAVNGGGFINTSRAILTTGTPTIGANGALAGFTVNGGNISVQGAGLNAGNVDQVDLIARAVQVNAAIYANQLNVVAGASQVDHDSLSATRITADDAAPTLAIDVGQLGGMYANRIFLTSNEYGVGVSNRGVLAAQAGDLTLTSQGQLVLAGQTEASGNLNASARDGIDSSGTTYAQQSLAVTTAGTLNNSGVLAAQHNATINAGSVSSSGTLGAGLNNDGSMAAAGDLSLVASGALDAHGRNQAGGNASLQGASLDLSGSTTWANRALALAATGGDMNLSGAGTTAGGALRATAAGALSNAGGKLSSGGAMQVAAGSVNNAGGQLVSQSTLDLAAAGALDNSHGGMQAAAREGISAGALDNTGGSIVSLNADGLTLISSGALSNVSGNIVSNGALALNAAAALDDRQGVIQSAGRAGITADSIDNTGGRIASLNGDGLAVTTTGALANGAGGTIGANGDLDLASGALSNQGKITAAGNAKLRAASVDNHGGSLTAGGALNAASTGALSNAGGTVSAGSTTVSAASIDNTQGDIDGDALSLSSSGDLINRGGAVTQYGVGEQTLQVGGRLDTGQGTIASNADTLHVRAQSIVNDSGTIRHAGMGTLDLVSKDTLSNASGKLLTNGALALNASGALDNEGGSIQAARVVTLRMASLDNSAGRLVSLNGEGMKLTANGAIVNGAGGVIGTNGELDLTAAALSNRGQLSAAGNVGLRAQTLDNRGGNVTAGAVLDADLSGGLDNTDGVLSGASTQVSAASIDNTRGDIDGDALAVTSSGDLVNRDGKLTQFGLGNQSVQAGGTIDNRGGTVASNAANLAIGAQNIVNDGGAIGHAGGGALTLNAGGGVSNVSGGVQTNGALVVAGASVDNTAGTLLSMQQAQLHAASGIDNRGGSIYGAGGLGVDTQADLDNTGGSVQTAGDLAVHAGGSVLNGQGTISANGAHGTANLSAGRVDNQGGKLTNAGDGAMTVSASDLLNTGGTLGGNGDLAVNAQTLVNNAGANLVAGGVASLNVAQRVDNTNGTLFGGTGLQLNQSGAAVVNDGGMILGGLDASVDVARLSNQGGSIRANRNVNVSGALAGSGNIVAGGNLRVAVLGDYLNDGANNLHADGDMSLSATGTLTNAGVLAANGALTVSGQDVVNTAAGDINSANTNLIAAGAITNGGRIEGDAVTAHSATVANTGTIIGNDVTLYAGDLSNVGAMAAIAGANSVHLFVDNAVLNKDGALIYSVGNLDIARDGTRDASGMLANQTSTLVNSAASIEADGDIDIAAHAVTNERIGMVTAAGTPQDAGSTTLTFWNAGLSPAQLGNYRSLDYPQWRWSIGQGIGGEAVGKLASPITVTMPRDQVVNLDTDAKTFSLTQPLQDHYSGGLGPSGIELIARTITNNPTQWYNNYVDNGDGTVSITFWPDFDPNKNIRPDQVKVDTSLGSDSHDYIEMSRTVQRTTTTDQLISAGTGATMQAQGSIRINADGGSIDNDSSTIAAGGDLIRRAVGGSVTDSGTVLQQTVVDTSTSTFYWHQKTGGSQDTKYNVDTGISQTTATVDALPAIATSNATVQTIGATINIDSVDRQGQTVIGSGVTGGNDDGTQTGAIMGNGGNAKLMDGNKAASASGQGRATGVAGDSAQAENGQSSAPQTLGGATGGIANLRLPVNGLYTYNNAPGATYLVVTDPRLTSYSSFISSDYMLSALNLDPQKTAKRLGDGAYEQTLVRNQITNLTGRTFLNGYNDAMAEYTALMNNGVAYARQFGLSPGIALTADQMAQLTTDMVWLVSQDVTLPDGSHQTVLVPQVYLARSDAVDLTHSGALVSGNAVNLQATGDVNNSGHVSSNLATTILGNNIVNRGVIGSAGTTAVVAVQDVRNTSGRIGGGDVVVQAGRDVINETRTYGVSDAFASNGITGRITGVGVDAVGTISASNGVAVLANRDVSLSGAVIQAGGNATVMAGRDLNVGTADVTGSRQIQSTDGLNGSHDEVTQHLGSAIVTGGNLATVSGRDTTFTGASVAAGGNAAMIAGGDLTVTASKDTAAHHEQSLGGKRAQHISSTYDEQVNGSSLGAGGGVSLAAGQNGNGNLTIAGSNVTASQGAVALTSTGDVNIGSVSETHDSQSWSHNSSSGFLSTTTDTDTSQSHVVDARGSTVSGDTVNGNARHDMTISGSTVAADHDVNLSAGHDLAINTSQDTSQSSTFHQETKSGLGYAGGAGISFGKSDQKDTANNASVTNNGSLVGSTGGSVNLTAGNNLHVSGSDLVAGQNVTGTGANVSIDASVDQAHHDETHETKTSGFSLAVKGGVIDAVTGVVSQAQAASNGQDGRAAALHGIAAAGSAMGAVGAANKDVASMAKDGGKPDVKIELSYGSSHSKSSMSEDRATQRGSSITAGGTAAFVATGSDQPGSGNVTIAGSSVNANDVIIAAKNQVNLVNTTDTDATRSANQSSSVGAGVSFGTSGWGIDASASKAHGDGNGDSATQNTTHINAANTATIISGGDTNLIGANLSGRQVNADVGGNLHIVSVQDTATSAAHQTSTGGGFSISQGGGSASISHTDANASGNYAGVNEQAGIKAGDGGFNINVKGNTDLQGGVIASDADASKNNLSTGTLSYSDVRNHSDYNAQSSGFSVGTSGIAPTLAQNGSGSQSAITRSAISNGTINVTDAANQRQDVAGLSRNTTDTNSAVAKLPDVNSLLSRQADMMAAAGAAGAVVAQRIGDYATSKYDDAKASYDAAKKAGDVDGMNAAAADMDTWKEGGASRAGMQAAGAAIVVGLAGGNAIGGAAGAGITSIAGGKLNDLSGAIAGASPTGNATIDKALGNIVAQSLVSSVVSAVSANAGSFAGSTVDQNNRQLHPEEKKVIAQLAGGNEQAQHRLEAAACALVRCGDQYAVGSAEGAYYRNLQEEGENYSNEQQELQRYAASAPMMSNGNPFFSSTMGDRVKDMGTSALLTAARLTPVGGFPRNLLPADYVSAQATDGVVSGTGTVNLHNGNTYANVSGSLKPGEGFSIVAGTIIGNAGMDPSKKGAATDGFVAGQSSGAAACYVLCVGISRTNDGQTAIEYGIGLGGNANPGKWDGNVGSGYSVLLDKNSLPTFPIVKKNSGADPYKELGAE